jgi:intracellular sulfur oxidation DsrE/DsrF family protein
VFLAPTKADGHLLSQRAGIPASTGMLGDIIVASSIPALQKMGTKFLLCANALGLWTLELEARGKGAAAALDKELRGNLVPGVTIVPAMVQAIEQAQSAGFSYNRQ